MKAIVKFSLLLFTTLLFWSCDQEQIQLFEKGFLEGKIVIGPLCPVETIPPDPACQPTEETYKNWPIVVLTIDRTEIVAKIEPNLNGTYRIDLPEGNYVVDLDKEHPFGKNLPATIVIEPDKTVVLNIDIDTGIR